MTEKISPKRLIEIWASNAVEQLFDIARKFVMAGFLERVPNKILDRLGEPEKPITNWGKEATEYLLFDNKISAFFDPYGEFFDKFILKNGPKPVDGIEDSDEKIEIAIQNCLSLAYCIMPWSSEPTKPIDEHLFKRFNQLTYVTLRESSMLFAEIAMNSRHKFHGIKGSYKTKQVKKGKENKATIEALLKKHKGKNTLSFRTEAMEQTGLTERRIIDIVKEIPRPKM